MEFTVKAKKFKKALARAMKAADTSKPLLPEYALASVEAVKNSIRITCHDGVTVAVVGFAGSDLTVNDENGPFAISATWLAAALDKADGLEVTVSSPKEIADGQSGRVTLTYGKTVLHAPAFNVTEPSLAMPSEDKKVSAGFEPEELKTAIESVSWTAAKNDAQRPVISGVQIECNPESGARPAAAATDSHVVAAYVMRKATGKGDFKAVLPMKSAMLLQAVLEENDGTAIDAESDGAYAVFSDPGKWVVRTALLNGKYPNWRKLLESSAPGDEAPVMGREALLDAVRSAALCAEEVRGVVTVDFDGESKEAEVTAVDEAQQRESSAKLTYAGETPQAPFATKGKWIADALGKMNCGRIVLGLEGAAIVVQPDADEADACGARMIVSRLKI